MLYTVRVSITKLKYMIRFNKEIQGTRESDHYATPIKFYQKLHNEFNFDYDPCPLRSEVNGFLTEWERECLYKSALLKHRAFYNQRT